MEVNNKKQIIIFANTLWFLINFKKDLIRRLSKSYQIKCYFLKFGDLENFLIKKYLNKDKNSIQYIKISIWISIKEFLHSLFAQLGLTNKKEQRFKIIVFTIVPIFLSPIIFFSHQSSMIYVLEGLGRVFSSRRIKFRILKRFVEFAYKINFKKAANVAVLNPMDAAYLVKKSISSYEKIHILPGTGLNLKKYNYEKFEKNKNEKYIDFIGRILPDKGFYEFLYSRKVFVKKYPNLAKKFKYRVIAPNRQIMKYGDEQLKDFFKEGIIFCPYKKDTNAYYQKTHILVHPTSYGEGLSMVILEASYLGIKLITSKNKGTEEILKYNYKYFLKDISPLEIADLIADASNNQEYFDSIKSNQRIKIRRFFDSDSSVKSFMKLIDNNGN